jgi:hypothetical protein
MTHDMREADTILRELVALQRLPAGALPSDEHAERESELWRAAYAWADAQKAPQPESLAHRLISSGPNAGRVKPEYVQKAAPTAAHPAGLTGADSDYRRMFGAAVASLAEISEALGIDEEKAACANGNELILEAISILAAKAQKAPQPRTAEPDHEREAAEFDKAMRAFGWPERMFAENPPMRERDLRDAAFAGWWERARRAAPAEPAPALSMKRHEWDSLSPEARKLIHDRTREHTLESARAAQAIRDTPLAEPAPAPADEPPPLPEPAWMTQLCGHDPHYFYTADQIHARDAYWIAKLQAERSKP